MEKGILTIEQEEHTMEMGENTSKVFAGEGAPLAMKEMYAESAPFFAKLIKNNLPEREEPYSLLDIGTSRGEFLKEIITRLPEYHFNTFGTDINDKALQENKTVENKIISNLTNLPFGDNSMDVGTMRYVLSWNTPEQQAQILREVNRVMKRFTIVQHGGAPSKNADVWRNRMADFLDGNEIPKVKRTGYYFASVDEIEGWMKESGINLEKVNERLVQNVSDIFIERHKLSEEEGRKAKEIFGEEDYIVQATWLLKK